MPDDPRIIQELLRKVTQEDRELTLEIIREIERLWNGFPTAIYRSVEGLSQSAADCRSTYYRAGMERAIKEIAKHERTEETELLDDDHYLEYLLAAHDAAMKERDGDKRD